MSKLFHCRVLFVKINVLKSGCFERALIKISIENSSKQRSKFYFGGLNSKMIFKQALPLNF